MQKITRYFISGFLFLIPLFILYQVLKIVASVTNIFWDIPFVPALIISLAIIVLIGFVVIRIFKKYFKRKLIKRSKGLGLFAFFARAILQIDNIGDRSKKAFRNPVLYKVDDGIYKLGFVTDDDITFLNNDDDQVNSSNEANPLADSVWIYAPYPINFTGEFVLVEPQKIRKLTTSEEHSLPLFILSAGIIKK